ncbi:hypothetical protein J6590_085537 [Homalodisca vitripennis]|nr:hypothetical protein J6590_085537 [Homalodisca vitripennis]
MIRIPFTSRLGLDSNNTYLDMKVLDGLVAAQTWDHVLGLQEVNASWYGGMSFACARSRTARWRGVSGECEVDRLPVWTSSP